MYGKTGPSKWRISIFSNAPGLYSDTVPLKWMMGFCGMCMQVQQKKKKLLKGGCKCNQCNPPGSSPVAGPRNVSVALKYDVLCLWVFTAYSLETGEVMA